MLAGKSVVMAGATLRGDLFRRPDRTAEGEKEAPTTAITIGRSVDALVIIEHSLTNV
jgi:dynactin 5